MPLAIATAAPAGAQAVDEAWRKAITANDLNAIMALYAEDAVMWLPDAPEAKGREAIRKAYADLLAANTVTGETDNGVGPSQPSKNIENLLNFL